MFVWNFSTFVPMSWAASTINDHTRQTALHDFEGNQCAFQTLRNGSQEPRQGQYLIVARQFSRFLTSIHNINRQTKILKFDKTTTTGFITKCWEEVSSQAVGGTFSGTAMLLWSNMPSMPWLNMFPLKTLLGKFSFCHQNKYFMQFS